MSNRPNDFDDDDFRFDDDDDNDDFRFDDDTGVDFDGGLGDDFDADLPTLEDDTDSEGRGPSRTFIIIAAVMIILFVVAIGLLIFLSRPSGPTPFELTSTAIANQNATVIAQGLETSTQAVILGLTETQNAINAELTAQAPTATETPTPSPSPTETPTVDPTQIAATTIALQTSAALTQAALPPALPTLGVGDVDPLVIQQAATSVAGVFLTQVPGQFGQPFESIQLTSTAVASGLQQQSQQNGAIIGVVAQAVTPASGILQTQIAFDGQVDPVAVELTSTAVADLFGTAIASGQGGGGEVSLPAVAQTATRLAELLVQPTVGDGGGGVIASPTAEGSFARATELPDTGLFDDIAAGSPAGLGAIILAIVGLIGVIVISRRLRSINK